MFTNSKKNAKLILSDGTKFEGKSLGEKGTTIGEIVFTTSMTGYLETLTDPSYYGQIVMQTFPLIGNYGVNFSDAEGEKPKLFGYIVKDCCQNPSNFRCEENLEKWLIENKIIAIKEIDTRKLTKLIRENGVLNGAITTEKIENDEEFLNKIRNFKIKDAIKNSSTKEIKVLTGNEEKSNVICVLDFGVKKNIVNNLKKRAKKVILMPHNTRKKEIEEINPDGIVLSNGPGDPAENFEIIENLKELVTLKIPIFGICLGHQLLALAVGAKTKKLKYGHRGANQPVLDVSLNKILITSQNHGFSVLNSSVNEKIAKISHVNLNDGSCEGLKYLNTPAFTVQFHPEAAAGPLDSNFLFDEFFSLIEKSKTKANEINS